MYCHVHSSVTDYWERKNVERGLGSIHRLLIGFWDVDAALKNGGRSDCKLEVECGGAERSQSFYWKIKLWNQFKKKGWHIYTRFEIIRFFHVFRHVHKAFFVFINCIKVLWHFLAVILRLTCCLFVWADVSSPPLPFQVFCKMFDCLQGASAEVGAAWSLG